MKQEANEEIAKIKEEISLKRTLYRNHPEKEGGFAVKRGILSEIRNLQIRMATYQKIIDDLKS